MVCEFNFWKITISQMKPPKKYKGPWIIFHWIFRFQEPPFQYQTWWRTFQILKIKMFWVFPCLVYQFVHRIYRYDPCFSGKFKSMFRSVFLSRSYLQSKIELFLLHCFKNIEKSTITCDKSYEIFGNCFIKISSDWKGD